MTNKELKTKVKWLERQIETVGRSLAEATTLVQTQDGEIGRLTALNDRMFRIIDKLITNEGTV